MRARAETASAAPRRGALPVDAFLTRADHRRFLEDCAGELERRRAVERALLAGSDPFTVRARCAVCRRDADLSVDYQYASAVSGALVPNWRERLVCPRCGLNNRMRATIHLVEELFRPSRATRVYCTEQVTPIHRWARARFRSAVGSEWLGDAVPPGTSDARGIRNEDLTRLTFADASFELVICLDVLEHVPSYLAALGECLRVLAPGGSLLLTCPFRTDRDAHLVRAVVGPDGLIEHREPPEYHGNPISAEGALAFYHFGWQLLDDLRAVGFENVRALQYWSREFGYLGADQIVFVARRPPRPGDGSWWRRLLRR